MAGLLPAVEAALLLVTQNLHLALLCGAGMSALHTKQGYATYDIPDVRFLAATEQQWPAFVLFLKCFYFSFSEILHYSSNLFCFM